MRNVNGNGNGGHWGCPLSVELVVVIVAFSFFCYSLEKSMIRRRTQRGRRKDMYVVRDVA